MPERKILTIHAETFQQPLGKLAATMVEKVFREGPKHIAAPAYVSEDIVTMLRYAMSVYNLLNYLNADERRNEDPDWFVRYGVTGMSMVRSLIDCLYNITAILEDPATVGRKYRMSGLKTTPIDIDNERDRHQGEDDWESYYKERRAPVELLIRMSNLTLDEVMQVQKGDMWHLYGTTGIGGSPGGGLLFKMDQLGNETVLYNFNSIPNGGGGPGAVVLADAGNLYGTTYLGGEFNDGVVFKLEPGGPYAVLHQFAGSDGNYPVGTLVLDAEGNLYGATAYGGDSTSPNCSPSGCGVVFKLDPAGNGNRSL